MNIKQYGLEHYLNKTQFKPNGEVCRITSEQKTNWKIIAKDGFHTAIIGESLKRKLGKTNVPKVGDFVLIDSNVADKQNIITEVLPRFSIISRKKLKDKHEQILATNIDTACLVFAYDQKPNLQLIKNYLSLVIKQDIKIILILNKVDTLLGPNNLLRDINTTLPEITCVSLSAKSNINIDKLEKLLIPQHTMVLLGPSGSGKSSLINLLSSQSKQLTQETGQYELGKHTTTSRNMFVTNNGSIVIDTPGLRNLDFDNSVKNIKDVYKEIESLSTQCKFRNCDHNKSAGCAIILAVKEGLITKKDYQAFLSNSQTKTVFKSSHKKTSKR